MTFKKTIGTLHLWLGFSSGLLVFIIAVTGCLYAFQAEISDLTQPFRFVEQQSKPFLPPSALKAVAEEQLPGKHIHAVLYSGGDRAAQVIFFSPDPKYYYIIYLNPYTAELLKVKDMDADFFRIVLNGHFYLWLPDAIGQPIVATACLVFLVMILSGLFLWWPRKKKDSKQRFRIKWNARWRRVNYDMHNVLGFYAFSIALILALTGLVWGFQWYAKGLYATAGGEKSLEYFDPPSDRTKAYDNSTPAIDRVFDIMREQYPEAKAIEVHIPYADSVAIAANANPDLETYWKIDYRYFDQYTLKEVSVDHIYGRFAEAQPADKLLRMNYDIHTGAVLGFPGKLLAFFASFICATLPITGFYIWWGRRNKKQEAVPIKVKADKEELSLSR
jgi:uncharacterized iron-regulated membrane protein